ncbi:MAG: Dethiobiotin synthetase [Gemmatimonadetes bacterium]|nr:Dethiobiotin synthetase [Gemmatimonadota bacterium]
MIRIGVTGTDTGAGKTVVTSALVALLRRRGCTVAAMKPVETGREPDDATSDAALLRGAAGGVDRIDAVRPILLPEPLAPWIAAERAGTPVDVDALGAAFRRLSTGRDAVVVEGAGGLLVPLTREVAFDELFRRWGLDVVIVAGNRLGVLNHALLTLRACHGAGLRVRGIVLNALSSDGGGLAERTNLCALADLAAPVPVLPFPWIDDPTDLHALADAAETAGFDGLIADESADGD